jgi:hypothetical protein
LPLPEPARREPIHTRRVECRGFRRSDGLWDIEGRLVDTKSYPFRNAHRGEIAPGVPLHDMWLRLTVDDELVVRDVAAVTDAAPYAVCPAVTPSFASLKGLRIGPGWRRQVLERVGGVRGCTHLVELLWPLATAAYQTVYPILARERPRSDDDRPPGHLDSCHALARDGEIVREHHPRWYTGPPRDPGAHGSGEGGSAG